MRQPWLSRVLAIALATAVSVPATAIPQEAAVDAEAVKAYLLDGFERAKATDVAFAETIPDSALSWAPTPGVRNFAEQVVHAANSSFIGQPVFGKRPENFFGEGATESRAALTAAVSACYDWILDELRATPAETLHSSGSLFGREMPKWRILAFALEHAMWTRGQLVPYFRMHGIDPPDVRLF